MNKCMVNKKNKVYATRIINILRKELNQLYQDGGHDDEVLYISQELDKYILLAQENIINNK